MLKVAGLTAVRVGLRSLVASRSAAVPSLSYMRQPVRHFPVCTVQTNLETGGVPADFHRELCKRIALTLKKPEELVTVQVTTNVSMVRGGSDAPTATVQIWSIGVFDMERNVQYTKDLFPYLTKALQLPEDRIALLFHPLRQEDAGHLIHRDLQKQ